MHLTNTVRRGLLSVSSLAALTMATAAYARSTPDHSNDAPGIVVRDDFNPNAYPPSGILDPVNINGVGQVVADLQNGFLGTCTGTLINPRTVIFAAHCVNEIAASDYGAATGGRPISVGFQSYNVPGLLNWLGYNDPAKAYQTNIATAIYNVENVWYDERSLVGGFLQADIAIATLDTPAFDIPTWAMLFTPLDGQEHVTVTGYGSIGFGSTGYIASGGWRRRAAENYVSFLGSLADRNVSLFGGAFGALPQNLYMSSMSDPAGVDAFDPDVGYWDFGIFGSQDVALPVEGITGSGDSGGPLILDQKYDIPLVLGVLSGGSRFFDNQNFGAYGSHSFYQPLSSFWQEIVANNPYVYATNIKGNGSWTDPAHWVQAMDPNYQIVLNGELINSLPSAPGDGTSGSGAKFGEVCYLSDCTDFTQAGPVQTGTPYFVDGGPGSINFVPDNVIADPSAGIRPHYYDVTLAAAGATWLKNADITIDRLTVAGPTRLDIQSSGSLNVLGEFTQVMGWTNVDGMLDTGEAFIMTGVLSGKGTFRAPWVTTAAAIVAPGGVDSFGTLTIDGSLVMASGSVLYIDAGRSGADLLNVTGLLSLSDPNDPASKGPAVAFAKIGAAPRFGQSFTIVNAGGGIEGTFGAVQSFQGVLRPELTYTSNTVVADMRAGKFVDIIGSNPTARAFAAALDELRGSSYSSLYNLYGMVDLMGGAELTATFAGLAPQVGGEHELLQQRESRALFSAVSDRLSMLNNGVSGSMSMVGAPNLLMQALSSPSGMTDASLSFAGMTPSQSMGLILPETMSGFISGGAIGGLSGGASLTDGGQQGRYFGMGLERQIRSNLSIGIAMGYAEGRSLALSGQSQTKTNQAAIYGSYAMGGGFYVGGIASYDMVELQRERTSFDGLTNGMVFGNGNTSRLAATAEAGVNLPVSRGLTLTPRAQLGYSHETMSGFQEQGGDTALRIDRLGIERLEARLGLRLAGSERLAGGWMLTPELKADAVRVISGSDSGLTVRFANASDVAIALPYAFGDTSWGEVRAGLSLTDGTYSFGAGVESAIGRDDLHDDRAMVNVGYRF